MRHFLLLGVLMFFYGQASGDTYHIQTIDSTINVNSDKVVKIIGGIKSNTYKSFSFDMAVKAFLPGDLFIIIDSYGGDIASGFLMVDTIDFYRKHNQKIVCIVNGDASSMAFAILSSCDVRLATSKSYLMFHYGAYDYLKSSEDGRLTAKRLKEFVRELEEDDARIKKLNNSLLKLKDEDYEMYSDNSHIWRADELYILGYLNSLVTIEKVIDDTPK